ncbi:MAG: ACT domain-containing protein [Oscillospiraceae bacterium]|nr:ACT domain-containing protein [Oscillospiraceae bacterium]MBQ4545440.1 ACT domain-containing protein [Oscillospiraceae bacterium]
MIYQISVFLENRAGQLAEITGLLAKNNVNIRAISIAEASDYGVLRMIVDDAEHASAILLENGNVLSMTPVSVVAVPDRPAGLADVLAVLADAKVDIEYMYSILAHGNETAYMVFRVSDDEKFANAINGKGLRIAEKAELGLK